MDYAEMIDALRGELLDLNEGVNSIQAKADGEKRELTEDETAEVDRLMNMFEEKTAEIERRERMQAQAAKLSESFGRKSTPKGPEGEDGEPTASQRKVYPRAKGADNGKWGWRNFGEFAASVRVGSSRSGSLDPRLVANAPTTYGSEGVGEDGGFAVPPDFRTAIMEKVMGVNSLLSRTDQQTSSSNTMTFPMDETTPWGTSGPQFAWYGEGSQYSQSKPSLKEKTLRLHKGGCLVPVTDELVADANALDSYLRGRVPKAIDFGIQNAIVNGSGAGQPVGILGSDCLISVAKDTSTSPVQAANTIRFTNILDMWTRLYAPCRENAVWLINQDIESQLYLMRFSQTSSTPVPVYLPAGGASASPYATLMGRPVIPVESCSTLGTQGDIILADLSQYMTVMKTGGVRSDVSVHLFFDYDVTAYKFSIRIAGMPVWGSAISPANGSNTLSCFVTLDTRS